MNTEPVISTFVDFNYFPIFTAWYNSLRYYGNNGRIKVYDWSNLNNFQMEYIKKFAEVVTVKNTPHNYYQNVGFIMHNIVDYMDECELKLDCDMIALDNYDNIFKLIKEGNFVGSQEFEALPIHYDKNHSDPIERLAFLEEFKPYCNYDLSSYDPNVPIGVFNAGLMGFSRSKHYELIKNCKDILYSDFASKHFYTFSEQNLLSFLLKLNTNIDRVNLPKQVYMNLWDAHHIPKKYIIVNDDGKYELHDTEGRKVLLYHFTAGIGAKLFNDTLESSTRGTHLTGNYLFNITPNGSIINEDDVSARGRKMWLEYQKSPIISLFDYFNDNGPFKTPKFYNIKFRKIVCEFCKDYFKNNNITTESKEVIAVALAYDYITLLDYTINELNWIKLNWIGSD